MASTKDGGKVGTYRHPCVSCGACCAAYRVEFYWREAETRDSETPVPQLLTEDLSPMLRCMKGTNQKRQIRCTALQGRVGESVKCAIYQNRPTPCRKFEASYEDGKKRKRCDEARAGHGLKPLTPQDWPAPPQAQNERSPKESPGKENLPARASLFFRPSLGPD